MSDTAKSGLLMKYFVLKPEGTDKYAAASRGALRRYADLIIGENPELAKNLREWADAEHFKMLEETTQ